MQNPLVYEERMTADDKSLFLSLGSVTLLLCLTEERTPWNAIFSVCICVCLCKSSIYHWMTVNASNVLRPTFWKTHSGKWASWTRQEIKGSFQSFDASDALCSLWWEHWHFSNFDCCDRSFHLAVEALTLSLFVSIFHNAPLQYF